MTNGRNVNCSSCAKTDSNNLIIVRILGIRNGTNAKNTIDTNTNNTITKLANNTNTKATNANNNHTNNASGTTNNTNYADELC